MTWQILVAASAAAIPDSDLSIEVAELAFANAELVPRACSSEAEVERAGAIADGLLTVGIGLGRQTLAALSRCRAIITVSHGYDHIDAATEHGIRVASTYFCHDDVANHTSLLLLACARKLTALNQQLAAGRWRRDLLGQIPPIYGPDPGPDRFRPYRSGGCPSRSGLRPRRGSQRHICKFRGNGSGGRATRDAGGAAPALGLRLIASPAVRADTPPDR